MPKYMLLCSVNGIKRRNLARDATNGGPYAPKTARVLTVESALFLQPSYACTIWKFTSATKIEIPSGTSVVEFSLLCRFHDGHVRKETWPAGPDRYRLVKRAVAVGVKKAQAITVLASDHMAVCPRYVPEASPAGDEHQWNGSCL